MYPAARPNSSARQPALMCVGFVGRRFFVFAIVLLWLTCSAPQLPRFVGLADSSFDFELPIRQIER